MSTFFSDFITIGRKEYARLIQQEIDLIRTSEKLRKSEALVKAKANEIKQLQARVLYYQKKNKMSRMTNKENGNENAVNSEPESPGNDVK